MPSALRTIFSEFGNIMGICPCCNALFRLNEARVFCKGKRDLSALDFLDAKKQKLEAAYERLQNKEPVLREAAKVAGREETRNQLRTIDTVFSGAGLNPQDVKVIFDPVEYVVFDGMAGEKIKRILLLGHAATNQQGERVQKSIAAVIKRGNVEFKTLRIKNDGSLELGRVWR